jgi:hypothetical protein
MITLGLDPSLTSYGYCIYDDSKNDYHKLVVKGRWKTTVEKHDVIRYLSIRENLRNIIHDYKITNAAMETPPIGPTGAWSQEKLYALYIYNMEVMYTEKVDILLIAPTQLHLFAKVWGARTVEGDWFKSDMVNTARINLLEKYSYPKHLQYYDKSQTKCDKMRHNGYLANPFPVIDIASLDKESKKAVKIQSDEADAFHASWCGSRFWNFYNKNLAEKDLTPSEWDLFARSYEFSRGKNAGVTEQTGLIFKENERFFRFSSDQ